MTSNVPSLQVAVADHSAIVKVNGRANFTTSVSFKHLFSELRRRGFENFLLDLSQCPTMDSTFLGVLAGTALQLSNDDDSRGSGEVRPSNSPSDRLRLINPNQRISDLLENLGVSDLFRTVQCPIPLASERPLTPAEEAPPSTREVSETCLEAHLLLMDLNPENVSKFKDVAQFLAEDLKKSGGERAAPDERRESEPVKDA